MFEDEKINYTRYLQNKPLETDPDKQDLMMQQVTSAVLSVLAYTCYADGRVKVDINGKFYGVYDCNTGKFFEGSLGDSGELGQPAKT